MSFCTSATRSFSLARFLFFNALLSSSFFRGFVALKPVDSGIPAFMADFILAGFFFTFDTGFSCPVLTAAGNLADFFTLSAGLSAAGILTPPSFPPLLSCCSGLEVLPFGLCLPATIN